MPLMMKKIVEIMIYDNSSITSRKKKKKREKKRRRGKGENQCICKQKWISYQLNIVLR